MDTVCVMQTRLGAYRATTAQSAVALTVNYGRLKRVYLYAARRQA